MKGIYQIENLVNGKIYLGSSKDITVRFTTHRGKLRRLQHPNKHLQHSYNLYGKESFKYTIIEVCDDSTTKEELLKIEQSYIDKADFSKLYNMNKKVTGGSIDILKKPLLLLDLNHNIIRDDLCGVELQELLGLKKSISGFIGKDRKFKNKYYINYQ